MLAQNADKVETAFETGIDKAGEFVDEKTKGKYADAIHKVQEEAKKVAGPGAGPGDKGDQQN
jgi:MT0933-like antitoxin protein